MSQTGQLTIEPEAKPRRNPGVSAVQQIYDALRYRIINFILTPGTNIAKNDIADEFGVSPTPVREALLRLADEGLVDIFPQSRTSVSLIDVQHAREAHFLRLSVEIEVVRVLSENMTRHDLAELDNWIRRQRTELEAGTETSFKIADNRFHEEMYRQAGVQGLFQLINTRRGHYDRIRGLYLLGPGRREVVVEEHLAIISALTSRDPDAAEAAVRAHLGKSLAVIDQIRDDDPDYFL